MDPDTDPSVCTRDDRAARRWMSVYRQALREGHDLELAVEVANWDGRNASRQALVAMAARLPR